PADAPVALLAEPAQVGLGVAVAVGVEGERAAAGRAVARQRRVHRRLRETPGAVLLLRATTEDDAALDVRHLHEPLLRQQRLYDALAAVAVVQLDDPVL